jgi:hypothetical protein
MVLPLDKDLYVLNRGACVVCSITDHLMKPIRYEYLKGNIIAFILKPGYNVWKEEAGNTKVR